MQEPEIHPYRSHTHFPTVLDGGPIYAETNPDWIIMEPWNAISSLAFLVPVVFWFLRIKGHYKEYFFLTLCMALLFLGGIGSTLYHAFRTSWFLFMLDVMPIQVLTLLVSGYFWIKILTRWYYIFPVLIPFVAVRFAVFYVFDSFYAVNAAYFFTGVMMFLPALILLIKTKFKHFKVLLIGALLFSISLTFRHIDNEITFLFPMGTHWLWHVFGAIGSGYLGGYLFRINSYGTESILTRN